MKESVQDTILTAVQKKKTDDINGSAHLVKIKIFMGLLLIAGVKIPMIDGICLDYPIEWIGPAMMVMIGSAFLVVAILYYLWLGHHRSLTDYQQFVANSGLTLHDLTQAWLDEKTFTSAKEELRDIYQQILANQKKELRSNVDLVEFHHHLQISVVGEN